MKLSQLQIPPPKLAQEFEQMCLDLFRASWQDPYAQFNGRPGQRQNGVDLFGQPYGSSEYVGVQCKVKDARLGAQLTRAEVLMEIANAAQFIPPLRRLIFATTAFRSSRLQEEIRLISAENTESGSFAVNVIAWEDVVQLLDEYPQVAGLHYDFVRSMTFHAESSPSGIESGNVSRGPVTAALISSVSERLAMAIDLLNTLPGELSLPLSRIADEMGFDNVASIAHFVDGSVEPSFKFLKAFATKYGVNYSWLCHASDAPFSHLDPAIFGPSQALALIDETSPEEVIFVRSKSEEGESTLVLRYNEWNHRAIPYAWNVSAHVGGQGIAHLEELRDVIQILRERASLHCSGQVLESYEFESLMNGSVFPGTLLARRSRDGDWWYALPDYEHRYPSAKNYGTWYGQSFLDAQKILWSVAGRNEVPTRS